VAAMSPDSALEREPETADIASETSVQAPPAAVGADDFGDAADLLPPPLPAIAKTPASDRELAPAARKQRRRRQEAKAKQDDSSDDFEVVRAPRSAASTAEMDVPILDED